MSILLFFIIGWLIEAPVVYWVIFGIYAICNCIVYFCKFVNAIIENSKED